jgi:hypothetical protein
VSARSKQIELGGLEDPAEEQAEIEAGYLWREQIYSAIRTFIAGYIANGQKGYEAAAAALDRRWGEKGRPVSASMLRAALGDTERNYFRAEWLDWFAARSPEVADLMARRVKPVKSPEEQLRDLENEIREELPKRADSIIRKARSR